MGVKVIYGVAALTFTSAVILMTGLSLPMHTVSFFTLYGVRVARMWTHMSSVKVETKDMDFCQALKRIVPEENLSWCYHFDSVSDLQDLQQRFCSPVLTTLWPNFCTGLQHAYGIGMLVLIALVLNILFQITAMYLLLDYGWRKANPKYRKASMAVLVAGFLGLCLSLALYGLLVLTNLSTIKSAGVGHMMSAVLSVSKGTGVSSGYIVLWLGLLFQLVAILLYSNVKTETGEDTYIDQKSVKQYLNDTRPGADGMLSDAHMMYGSTNAGPAIADMQHVQHMASSSNHGWQGQQPYQDPGAVYQQTVYTQHVYAPQQLGQPGQPNYMGGGPQQPYHFGARPPNTFGL